MKLRSVAALAARGQPLAGACVTATGARQIGPASTGREGRLTLRGLRAGRYTLEYRDFARPGRYQAQWSGQVGMPAAARPLPARAGQVTRAGTITLAASPAGLALAAARGVRAGSTGAISGQLTSTTGKVVTGTCAEAVSALGAVTTVAVGAKGGYTIRGLVAGTCKVRFASLGCAGTDPGDWAPQWYRRQTAEAKAASVTVKAGATTTSINGTAAGVRISARVTVKAPATRSGVRITAAGPVRGLLRHPPAVRQQRQRPGPAVVRRPGGGGGRGRDHGDGGQDPHRRQRQAEVGRRHQRHGHGLGRGPGRGLRPGGLAHLGRPDAGTGGRGHQHLGGRHLHPDRADPRHLHGRVQLGLRRERLPGPVVRRPELGRVGHHSHGQGGTTTSGISAALTS